MNHLFIHPYLDEDVDVLVARLLRRYQFDATTAHEAGQRGRSDEEQLRFATDREMAILTHNRDDFEKLAREYYSAGRSHAGIIIAVRRRPHEVARRLLDLMNQVAADEVVNQTRYI